MLPNKAMRRAPPELGFGEGEGEGEGEEAEVEMVIGGWRGGVG